MRPIETVPENLYRVNALLSKLASSLKNEAKDSIILSDFDNCAMRTNACGEFNKITGHAGAVEEYVRRYRSGEIDGFILFKDITNFYRGYEQGKILEICEKVRAQNLWREGAREVITKINKTYPFFFVSGGIHQLVATYGQDVGLPESQVLACKWLFENNKCLGPEYLVTGELKGYIPRNLKSRGFKVITIGNDWFDMPLLQNGLGIGICPTKDVEAHCKKKINNFSELEGAIEDLLGEN